MGIFINMIDTTYIYLVENCYNNINKIYIGKTIDVKAREKEHKHTYGKSIIFTIIDEIYSLEHADWEPLETYWIEQFTSWGFDVMNIRKKGGSGPILHTEETKQKISNANKGKPKPKGFGLKVNASKRGMIRPKEWGIQQSLIKKGKPNLKLRGQKYNVRHILQYDLHGNFIKEWNSASEVDNILNIKFGSISTCLTGKTKTAGGFVWKYK